MREERPIIALTSQFRGCQTLLEHFPEDEKLFVKSEWNFSMQLVLKLYITSKGLWTQHFP